MSLSRSSLMLLLVLSSLLSSSGCATFNGTTNTWKWRAPWSKKEVNIEEEFGKPERMVVVWTPDVLSMAGKPATRGFGGRIYFYNTESKPVPVEGQLVVYGYDDSDEQNKSREAQKKYAFTKEQFETHFSQTELGASYSVWVPWDSNCQDQRAVSLVPVFTSVSGKCVVGQQSLNVLPSARTGKLVSKNEWRRRQGIQSTQSGVEPASYEEDFANGMAPPRSALSMQTTTISVPRTLTRRMAANVDPRTLPPPEANTDSASIARNLEALTALQQQQAAQQQTDLMPTTEYPSLPPRSGQFPVRLTPNRSLAPASQADQSARDQVPWPRRPRESRYFHPFSQ